MSAYRYGMRLRGYGIACQPKGVIAREDDESGRYYDIIVYDRELSEKEVQDYELDYLNEERSKTMIYDVVARKGDDEFTLFHTDSEAEAVKAARDEWETMNEYDQKHNIIEVRAYANEFDYDTVEWR